MKFNKMRDFMKYLTKYITKDILIVISILLFVSIVFLVLTRNVIENVENKDKTKTPRDKNLSEAAKKLIDTQTNTMTNVTKDLNNHVSAVTRQTDKKKPKNNKSS